MITDQFTESLVSLFKLRLTAAREAATLLQVREGSEGGRNRAESSKTLVTNRTYSPLQHYNYLLQVYFPLTLGLEEEGPHSFTD